MTPQSHSARPVDLRRWLRTLPVLVFVVALLPLSGIAQATPETDGYCRNNGRPNIDLFLDHAEVGQRLDEIERYSGGNVEVDVAGQSFNGRDIWTARVGHGDQVMLVQASIHGNEKHGPRPLLDVVERLGADTERAAEIRDRITLVAIPMLNVDGSELNQRQNDMTWADTVSLHPQLEGAPAAWYHNANVGGFDVNRDFHPDLDYVPDPADLPGASDEFGYYLTPTAQTVRDVYRDLETEFGRVDYFVDLHGQAACYRWGDDTEVEDRRLTYLSLSGEIVDEDRVADFPELDLAASRRANVAIHDALQYGDGANALSRLSRYPEVDLPGTALGSFALRGSAVVLFETSGQTGQLGHHRINLLERQVDIGLMGLVDEVTDGTIDDIDPDRFFDIPARAGW